MTNQSTPARAFTAPKAITLRLLGQNSAQRLADLKELLYGLEDSGYSVNIEDGLVTGPGDGTFTIRFHLTFPNITLDDPVSANVQLINWTATGDNSSEGASIARNKAYEQLVRAIDDMLKPGAPLNGKIRRAGQPS